jgi:ComF family protein
LIPYQYATPLKQAISAFKFHSHVTYAPMLACLFITALNSRQSKMPECIIPVPLHPKRLQQRGFNQSLELAKIIARHLNIPVDATLCQRNSNTAFQSGLTAKQRKHNLLNAFEIVKSHQFKHVAIFDDVVTTGTTVNELARKLKLSGIEIIEVWAIARTVDENA